MDGEALRKLSASELAAAIVRGETTAQAAVEAAIARIEQVNGALNAVVVKRYAEARAAAIRADDAVKQGQPLGPLHGVPVTIKECLDLTGTPSTFGLSARASLNATQDDAYVARLQAAGAIIVGKTNVAQMLMYYESVNPVYGQSNNPYNPARTPGGSSGGEGAILAAGGVPLGLGTDIGGSVRIPAAFCGIASIKPTTGRTPDAGRYSFHPGQQTIPSQVGPMARTVADVALGLRVIDSGEFPLVDPATVDISTLHVAYYTDDGTVTPSPAAQRAVREAADRLQARGVRVTEWAPPDVQAAIALYYGIMTADRGQSIRRTLQGSATTSHVTTIRFGMSVPHYAVSVIRRIFALIGQRSAGEFLKPFGHRDTYTYWQNVDKVMRYRERFRAALDSAGFDAIICPPSAFAAFPHGASELLGTAGGYATLYNLLGYPAGVVPFTHVRSGEEGARKPSRDRVLHAQYTVEQGSAGLPIGVQVVAKPWQEHIALALMQTIENSAKAQGDVPDATG